ncbi:MAG: hypothetical protein JWL75_523 [Parcubacteria group bacterium]|nr:hypothetical protein [Parcubacteria group bacterium]
MKNIRTKGFTLIELLVVIAIIGVLSSVVLASLNSARNKGKDAAIKEGVQQMRSLMALEYNDTGTYTALEPGRWFYSTADCAASFSGTYAANARTICSNLFSNTSGSGSVLFIGNAVDPVGKFAIMVLLNSKNTYYCAGSSGATSDIETGGWGSPGCYGNP